MLKSFNNVSLAALIISCGYLLDTTYSHWPHGLSFHMRGSPGELQALRVRLIEMGIITQLAQSTNRYDRAVKRIVIPYSEFVKLRVLVGDIIIESKKHLIN